jgi:hypothetical protein
LFGSAILDTVIGIVFVYLTLSTVVSAIAEQLSTHAKLRGKILELLIARLFGGTGSSTCQRGFFGRFLFGLPKIQRHKDFIEHDLIKALSREDNHFPAFIPADAFAEVVVDLLTKQRVDAQIAHANGTLSPLQELTYLRESLAPGAATPDCFSDEKMRRIRKMFHRAEQSVPDGTREVSKQRLAAFQAELADWFNKSGDRSSGWYKRAINRANVVMAILLVVAINIDSVILIKNIYSQPAVRESLATSAQSLAEASEDIVEKMPASSVSPTGDDASVQALRETMAEARDNLAQLDAAGLPIG